MNPATLFDPMLLAAVTAGIIMFGLIFYFWQARSQSQARSEVRKRLDIHRKTGAEKSAKPVKAAGAVASRMAKSTDSFYSASDPKQKRKLRMQLIQAGFYHDGAVGYFFLARFGMATLFAFFGLLAATVMYPDMALTSKLLTVLSPTLTGYFAPNKYLDSRRKKRERANREGFPDVMDLMVVAAEAGLTTEASIERIAHEIRNTYPSLSEQLHLASIEIRAGRPLDEALRSFGERVGLEEVQGFATMIQQSKELGTSVSDALRVYSDEMRHKRMMAAEEKAYALPAKLSVPVTLFILPIVIGVAVVPTIVRMTAG
ncbi:MAG: type II secretion system F family protein [Nitratireductor sp.]|nr:type II secretion system F family protein [Nitratireductor sp.]MCC0019986.1 type II secretion system F family protein [Nitratireductor sp.]